jgi:CCR4-NOT complex subunit CAF16
VLFVTLCVLLQWRRDVAFAGFDVPLQMDIPAEKMIFGVQGIDAERRDRLIKVLI